MIIAIMLAYVALIILAVASHFTRDIGFSVVVLIAWMWWCLWAYEFRARKRERGDGE